MRSYNLHDKSDFHIARGGLLFYNGAEKDTN